MNVSRRLLSAALVCATLALSACGGNAEPEGVNSILSGQISVSADVDSVADYSGFEVLVFTDSGTGADTLGYAVTDSTGAFRMDINAPERAVYPLAISRLGRILRVTDLVVADGDTASFRAVFPAASTRPLLIRSRENGAWMAYRNVKTQHNQALYRLVQSEGIDTARVDQTVAQTVNVLWGIQDTYEGTIGAELAAAESVLMLEGVQDSLAVARARTIDAGNPSFAEVAQAARRAEARLNGPEAGIALLEEFADKLDEEDAEKRVAIEADRIVALMQNGQRDEAITAARDLSERYPESTGSDWATRLIYDLEHLMPGMEAPHFSLTSQDGETVTRDGLLGQYVLLEFYNPVDQVYNREIPARNALYTATHDLGLEIVSVSVQPDTTVNRAFYDTRPLPGIKAVATGGPNSPIIKTYNVHGLPKRILINREGEIVSSYTGGYMPVMMDEVATLLANERQPS